MPKSKREAIKNRLIDAAIQVVGNKGFRKTTVPQIARKAGVSTGTFYLYFNDKSHVFVDAIMRVSAELRSYVDRVFQERLASLQGRVVQNEDIMAGLSAIYSAFFDYVDNYRSHFLILFLEGYSHNEDFSGVLEATYRNLAEDTRLRLMASEQLGLTRPLSRIEAETISWAIVGLLAQTAQMYISGTYDREEVIRVLVGFTWKGIKKEVPVLKEEGLVQTAMK